MASLPAPFRGRPFAGVGLRGPGDITGGPARRPWYPEMSVTVRTI